MSIQAMAWALEQRVSQNPSARHVLLCLANYADAEGRGAFPSIATLVHDTCMSERGIRKLLRELEVQGLIRAGNQALAHTLIKRKDRITKVWDLSMPPRGAPHAPRRSNGVNTVHPEQAVDKPVDETATGCTTGPNGVHRRPPRGAPGAPDPKRSVRDPNSRGAPSTGLAERPEAPPEGGERAARALRELKTQLGIPDSPERKGPHRAGRRT